MRDMIIKANYGIKKSTKIKTYKLHETQIHNNTKFYCVFVFTRTMYNQSQFKFSYCSRCSK